MLAGEVIIDRRRWAWAGEFFHGRGVVPGMMVEVLAQLSAIGVVWFGRYEFIKVGKMVHARRMKNHAKA